MEVDILQKVWSDVIPKGLPFCAVCLRSSEEVRLVNVRHVRDFASQFTVDTAAFNSPNILNKLSACLACEKQALQALRFHAALKNSTTARYLLTRRINAGNRPAPPQIELRTQECNKKLHEYRMRTSLRQTEVLIVDSLAGQWRFKATDAATNTSSQPSKPEVETVILDDDDDDSATEPTAFTSEPTIPKIVPLDQILDEKNKNEPIAALVPNQPQIITRHPVNKESFLIHPIVSEEGNFVVPSLSAKLINKQLYYYKSPTLTIENGVISQNKLLIGTNSDPKNNGVKDAGTFKVGTLLQDMLTTKSNKGINAPNQDFETVINKILQDKLNSIVDNRKRSNESVVIVDNKKQRSSDKNNVDLDIVTKMLQSKNKTIVNQNLKNTKSLVNNIDTTQSAVLTPIMMPYICDVKSSSTSKPKNNSLLRQLPENCAELSITDVWSEAQPPTRTGKVDWEDKIPMDLISFAGPRKVHMKSSQVETSQNQTNSSAKQPATDTKKPDPSIIDLC